MIATVTLNPALDYLVYTEKLRLGEVNRSSREELFCGGKGINVSIILHRLGIESTALGFVAGFTGDELERQVRERGVRTDFIRLPHGMTRINVKLKSTEETDINGAGPVIDRGAMGELLAKIGKMQAEDHLCLSGAVPATAPEESFEDLLRTASERRVKLVVDTSGETLAQALPFCPFLVKPNHHELGELLGKEPHSIEEITEGAAELQKRGAKNVLVSMAGDGALLLDESGAVHQIGVPEGTVKNSVGAGDSMVAGFLAGLLRTGDYATALRLGTAAGSATAFSEDLAERDLIDRLFALMK